MGADVATGAERRGGGAWPDEFIEALRTIWTADPVELRGAHFRVAPSVIGLKPVQKPHPPIYLAAFVSAALERAATLADGWLPSGLPLPALAKLIPRFRALARGAGRDPAALEVIVMNGVAISDTPLEEGTRGLLAGSARQIQADLGRFADLGVTELVAWTGGATIETALVEIERVWAVASAVR